MIKKITAIKKCLWLFVLVSSISYAQVYRWVDENGQVHFGDKPPQTDEESAVESLNLPVQSSSPADAASEGSPDKEVSASPPIEYQKPKASETLRIRQLFERGEFRQLNTLLEDRLSAFRQDVGAEWDVLQAYNAFDFPSADWERQFERWLAQSPSAYQPFVARANYYYTRAWEARGGKFIQETPRENIEKMEAFLALAQADIDEALRLQRQSLAAYYLQIYISSTLGDKEGARTAMRRGTEYHPYSYYLHSAYLTHLEPRWGGSLQQMLDHAVAAQQHVEVNPSLKHLLTEAHGEVLRYLYRDDKYDDVIAMASDMIEFHPGAPAYYYRGRSYFWQKQYAKARDDFNAAIKISPDSEDYYYWRARAHRWLNQNNQALRDIFRAYALNPESEKIGKFRDKLLSRVLIRDIKSVKHDPNMGKIRFKPDPDDPEELFNYAKTQIIHKDFEGAVASLDQAIVLNPGERRYYQLADDVLFKLGRLQDILGYWGRYIVHQPKDGYGYFERSGTYYHLQDLDAALADAERAVQMGEEAARELRDELRALTH